MRGPRRRCISGAIASYPTLYYWPVFILGEAVTRGLHLTPYQSTYAYRIVSAALAAMLWGAVYVVMRRVLSSRATSRDITPTSDDTGRASPPSSSPSSCSIRWCRSCRPASTRMP